MNVQRIRVPCGFLFTALFLYFASPTPGLFAWGTALALLGLGLRLWASGYLEKFRGLAVSGPYRWTRNPLYLGSFLMGLGLTAAGGTLWLCALFPLLFALLYWPVMLREEAELLAGYGDDFAEYRRRVPLFFPSGRSLARARMAEAPRAFHWKQVWANREHHAWIGFLCVVAVILLRMLQS